MNNLGTTEHIKSITPYIRGKCNRWSFLLQRYQVDDLMQEVFMKYEKAVNTFDESKGYKFKTWFNRLAYNVLCNLHVAANAKSRIEIPLSLDVTNEQGFQLIELVESQEMNPEQRLWLEEKTNKMVDLIINHKYSVILSLYFFHNLNNREISERYGRSYSYVQRITKEFKEEILC